MIKAQVLTNWINVSGVNEPAINLQFGDSMMDVTGQQTIELSPGEVVWEVWTSDITPYDEDANLTVIWWEEIDDEAN